MPKRFFVPTAKAPQIQSSTDTVKQMSVADILPKIWRLFCLSGSLTLLTSAFLGTRQSFRVWQRGEQQRIEQDGRIIETAVGLVEYQVVGQGPAILYAHGTPGGYDQGCAFSQFFDTSKCMLISPSRPGYLRTPLTSGASPEEQADLYAALLDALGIEQAGMIGFSGGGPSALQFALRYPERCSHLVMIGAIVRRYCPQETLQAQPFWQQHLARLTEYLLVSDLFLYCILPLIRLLPFGHIMAGMLCSGTIYHLRKAGYENDQKHFAAMEEYPLEQIVAPTLIVHGTHDEDVPFSDAELLLAKVARGRLVPMLKGNHATFFLQAKILIPIIQKFFLQPEREPLHS
ncbi:alpha/beta fold hydrolase [Dictyobacter arantiisoli]|uniref:alpha/beta fold hydrolase n=1 Tax=Dictyobacter arantiisoli TaxID=2014874 RepID=UPI00155A6352|nr:alpha/beta hydrolase [Dictyobacter arantiisoli]